MLRYPGGTLSSVAHELHSSELRFLEHMLTIHTFRKDVVLRLQCGLQFLQIKFGELTIRFSLQQLGPSLSGSTVSLFSSALICIAWTLLAPGDRESFKRYDKCCVIKLTNAM